MKLPQGEELLASKNCSRVIFANPIDRYIVESDGKLHYALHYAYEELLDKRDGW